MEWDTRLQGVVEEVQRLEGWAGRLDELGEDEQVMVDVRLTQRRQQLLDLVGDVPEQELREEFGDLVEVDPLLQMRE